MRGGETLLKERQMKEMGVIQTSDIPDWFYNEPVGEFDFKELSGLIGRLMKPMRESGSEHPRADVNKLLESLKPGTMAFFTAHLRKIREEAAENHRPTRATKKTESRSVKALANKITLCANQGLVPPVKAISILTGHSMKTVANALMLAARARGEINLMDVGHKTKPAVKLVETEEVPLKPAVVIPAETVVVPVKQPKEPAHKREILSLIQHTSSIPPVITMAAIWDMSVEDAVFEIENTLAELTGYEITGSVEGGYSLMAKPEVEPVSGWHVALESASSHMKELGYSTPVVVDQNARCPHCGWSLTKKIGFLRRGSAPIESNLCPICTKFW